MGFYGHISNNSRGNFTFDKIYSNRKEMDEACASDGIFIGRYVLVEYDGGSTNQKDDPTTGDQIFTGYIVENEEGILKGYTNRQIEDNGITFHPDENAFLSNANDNVKLRVLPLHSKTNISKQNKRYYSTGIITSYNLKKISNFINYPALFNRSFETTEIPENVTLKEDYQFYIINDNLFYYKEDDNNDSYLIYPSFYFEVRAGNDYRTNSTILYYISRFTEWTPWTAAQEDDSNITVSDYEKNYNIDTAAYGSSRGYDSTVWQKTFVEQQAKYVMIAELNSVVPTFNVTADAPTLTPVKPHFDSDSTNIYYNLHLQPQWGLRTKTADPTLEGGTIKIDGTEGTATARLSTDEHYYPSDEQTVLIRDYYDTKTSQINKQYYDKESSTWVPMSYNGLSVEPQGVDTAIYYNKKGFDKAKISYSDDLQQELKYSNWNNVDKISISPTGQSGHVYNKHGDEPNDVAADTQELSIMLPSLGNTMAEIWDLVYGGRDTNADIATTNQRNLDIAWEDASEEVQRKGLRLVSNDERYGVDYTPAEANTIAGAINSAHDLMGMIISNELNNVTSDDEYKDLLDRASDDYIYYANGEFYRRGVTYKYTPLTESNYTKNNVVINNSGDIQNDLHYTDDGTNYYTKGINKSTEFKLIKPDLIPFEQNRYFTYIGKNYYLADKPKADTSYYTIDTNLLEPVKLDDFTTKNYYYASGNNYLLIDKKAEYNPKLTYYKVSAIPVVEGKIIWDYSKYATITTTTDQETGLEIISSINLLDAGDKPKKGTLYYEILNEPKTISYYKFVTDPDGTNGRYIYVTERTVERNDIAEVGIDGAEFVVVNNTGRFYRKENDNYYYIAPHEDKPDEFYVLNIEKADMYVRNKYYYQNNNNYVIDKNVTITADRVYYAKIPATKITDRFYIPNLFYYKNNDEYEIDTNETMTVGRDYYEHQDIFIIDPTTGILISKYYGSYDAVPKDLTLASRKEEKDFIVIKDFARNYNTINGLILKINNLLLTDDIDTRDNKTLQGALNNLNDILNRFKSLNLGDIVIVDNHGNISGASYSTAQNFESEKLSNIVHNNLTTRQNNEDRFITLDITAQTENPTVKIEHNYNPVNDTTATISEAERGDTITLTEPIVDNVGHIVGKHSTDITLPYSFKTITTNGRSAVSSGDNTATPITDDIVADRTKDTLTINSGNKWVKIDSNSNTDTLTISHDIHTPNTTNKNATDLNTPAIDTITLQDIAFDEAGHMTENRTHQYILPYGFKKVAVNQAESTSVNKVEPIKATAEAENTQDTLQVNVGNIWLTAQEANKVLTIGHNIATTTQKDGSNITNNNFGSTITIPDFEFDEAGHLKTYGTHTENIPQGQLIETTPKTTSNVLTDLTFAPTTGTITTDRTTLGDINLGADLQSWMAETSNGEQIQNSSITTNTKLITALSILDTRIAKEELNRKNEIDKLAFSEMQLQPSETISTISEDNGIIKVAKQGIEITANQISDIDTTINKAITALNLAETYEPIGASDNKYDDSSEFIYKDDATKHTIQWLFTKVKELEDKIIELENQNSSLENRIIQLENSTKI